MITISNDYALSLLEDRLETAIYNGVFDNLRDFNPFDIVDNDIVNYCHVISSDDKDHEKLLKLYHDGYLDVSCEEFEEYGISFIEVVSDDETRILIRH